jgi:putative ABC transport system substrate-binding protein
MKKIYLLLALCICTLLITTSVTAIDNGINKKKIFISKVVDHKALDMTVKGIIDTLTTNGFIQGNNLDIRIESAQANAALAAQIASKFVNKSPDVVLGVGTMSAQSFAKYAMNNQVQLIFSSITDPIGANLVQTLTKPNKNISGVSNFVSLEPQVKLFKTLQPSLKRLGFIYNPGEPIGKFIVAKLNIIAPHFNLTIVPQTVTKTSEIPQATTKLAYNVDAIFISNDNTALSSLQSIIKVANTAKIPVYVSDTDAVELGALAAIGPNQYSVGQQTGQMLVRCLEGEKLENMPVEFPTQTELYINLDAAKIVGLSIPESILKTATHVKKNDI